VRKGVLILAALVLLGFVTACFSQIQPGERGLVRRFGRFVGQVKPGLHFGWPYPIERVDRLSLDLARRLSVGFQPVADVEDPLPAGQMLTGDHNLINVQVLVDYTLAENGLEDFLLQAGRVETLLHRATESLVAEWIAARPIDDVLLRGKLELPQYLVDKLQQSARSYRLGVIIQKGSVPYLYPPTQVKLAFDEVKVAQTAIGTREQEAKQEAGQRRRQAEAEANRIESIARADAAEQLLLAQADAKRFEQRLQQYRSLSCDKPAYLTTIWWEEMGSLLTKLRQNGRIDFLDSWLGGDGLDIMTAPAAPNKKP
jgi:modulator of FtsH protease HflK